MCPCLGMIRTCWACTCVASCYRLGSCLCTRMSDAPTAPPVVMPHAVPANVELGLLKYNASEPWYIGGRTTKLENTAKWGDTAHGGAGMFISRGALQWMEASYTACAMHTAQPREPGDRALGRCVLLHDIPVIRHPGMHFADGWHRLMWEHHPAAPFLAIHDNRNVAWTPGMRAALAVNPSGFSQQARLLMSLPGSRDVVVHISSGVAVSVWEEGTPGTDHFRLPLPGRWMPLITNPPQVERPGALAHFTVSGTQGPQPQGYCSIVTTYSASKQPAGPVAGLFSLVEVHEPFWPDRWRHAPIALCATAWNITTTTNSSSSSSSVSKLTVHLGRGPDGCLWEGFPSSWDPERGAAQ
jgi:hypothetical protein